MSDWLNIAQAHADDIKRRRGAVADLRYLADLVEDGLPVPIGIHHKIGDGTRVQVRPEDLADWLLYFEQPMPVWKADVHDGEHAEVPIDHNMTLVAFRRAVAEQCS